MLEFGSSDNRTNYFLGIGINHYQCNSIPDLANPKNDVGKVKSILCQHFQLKEKHCILLYNEEATKEGIISTLTNLVRTLTDNDNLIIYFAGHGNYIDYLSQGYWLPYNAVQNSNSQENWISNAELRSFIEPLKCHHFLLISDSCFSGSFLMDNQRFMGGALGNFSSRLALCSGRKEPVSDGNEEHSPIALALINFLARKKTETVYISQLIQAVSIQVDTNYDQTPLQGRIKFVQDSGGEFILYPRIYTTPSLDSITSKEQSIIQSDQEIRVKVHKIWGKLIDVPTVILENLVQIFKERLSPIRHSVNYLNKTNIVEVTLDSQVNAFIAFQIEKELKRIPNTLNHPFLNPESKEIVDLKNNLFSLLESHIKIPSQEIQPLIDKAVYNTLVLNLDPENYLTQFIFNGRDKISIALLEKNINYLPTYKVFLGRAFEKIKKDQPNSILIKEGYFWDHSIEVLKSFIKEKHNFTTYRENLFKEYVGFDYKKIQEMS